MTTAAAAIDGGVTAPPGGFTYPSGHFVPHNKGQKNMLRCKVGLALSLVVLMVSSASAQEGRGGRRGGFGGQFGGAFNSPMAILRMKEVQKEIKATKGQQKQIDEGLEAMRGGFNFQELQSLSKEDREKRMEEFRKNAAEAGKAFEEKMNKLLKPKQIARLNELSLQLQGAMALTRPEIAKDLGLTEDQQTKMQGILQAARPEGSFDFQGASQEERQKWMTESRERQEKAQAELLALLTDEQKAKFTAMKGAEFKFPEPRFGGNRGGRRPAAN